MPQAICHNILSRARADDFGPTLLSDFTLTDSHPVPPETLLGPTWSLYGLDFGADQAVFVETPPGLDLSTAAFVQIDQFRHATGVISVPLPDLPAVAALMPQPDQHILLFSMGRCGSTLASKVLATVPGVLSLSEPGPYLGIALARHSLPAAQQRSLLAALTRLLFRPRSARDRVLALKFHSQVLFLAEHLAAEFPQARLVFQYRDGVSWAKSFSSFMQMMHVPLLLQGEDLTRSWRMMTAAQPFSDLQALHDTSQPLPHDALLAPGWAMHMRHYLHLRSLGLALLPLRYNAAQANPTAWAQSLITHCHLPQPDPAALAQVFAHDSQEGTQLARSTAPSGWTDQNATGFRSLLAHHAPELDPDMILPA